MSWHTPEEAAFLAVSRKAMNDEFEVTFPRLDFPQGTEAAMDALDVVQRWEQVLSVFRFDSRIRYINLTAHDEPVRLERELFDLLALCRRISEETGGALDLTSGPLWKAWGFARREGRVPSEAERVAAMENVDYRLVELDEDARTVRFLREGAELNFGCVGKGFALDAGAVTLRDKGVDRFLFQGGLSSVLASGTGWKIGVAHPVRPGRRLAEIRIDDRAIGTSGSEKQFFRHRGHRYSHLIDPRTGVPAEGVLSVTVLAPDATLAELLSTAFFVLGPEAAEAYCQGRSDIAALFSIPVRMRAGFEVRVLGDWEDRLDFVSDDVRL